MSEQVEICRKKAAECERAAIIATKANVAVEKCVLSDYGKMRTLWLKGRGIIVETLVRRDDHAHSYTYKIVSSPLPVSDYASTIKVLPKGSGSLIVWTGKQGQGSE